LELGLKKETLKMRKLKNRKGFTLLEMMLVILFIGVGFLSILQLMVANLAAEKDIESTYLAMNIAAGKMEQLANLPFNSIVSENTVEVTDFPGYYQFVNVVSAEASLKQITVRLSWLDQLYLLETLRGNI